MITVKEAHNIAGKKLVEKCGNDFIKQNMNRISTAYSENPDSILFYFNLFKKNIGRSKTRTIGGDEYPDTICKINVSLKDGTANYV